MEFVPVPPLEAESRGKPDGRKSGDRRRSANDTRPRPSRGGAGLELDLTDHLTPGTHTIRFVIENVRPKNEKGDHGYWRVSAAIMGVTD